MPTSKPVQKPEVVLDDILVKFSISGRFYVGFIILIALIDFNDAIMCADYVFFAESSSYRCVDERFKNDSCASLGNSTEVCSEWVYDDPHSFVAQFQLACQEWKRTLVGTMQSLGYGVGLLFIGPLSDRFGRKKIIISALLIGTIMGIAKSLITNYWCFLILQLFHAVFGNAYSPSYILMIEMITPEKRALVTILCAMGSTLGVAYIPLLAWLIPYWRNLLLAFYVPPLLFVSYIYFLDESSRWLLCKGEKDTAITLLQHAAKRSKVEIDKDMYDSLTFEKNVEEISWRQTLKVTLSSKVLLKRFIMCLIWWTTSTFVGYGITINSVSLPGNKYANYALLAVVELPSKLTCLWILKSFKRKTSLLGAFFVSAIVCLIQPFPSNNMQWLSTTLYFCGDFMVNIFFGVTYIYTSELFPTYTRNSMHALCSSLGRIGSILAPQTPLLITYWHGLPSMMFGAVSLLAAFVTLFAPKTGNDVLPDNVRQAEVLGNDNPIIIDDENSSHTNMQQLSGAKKQID